MMSIKVSRDGLTRCPSCGAHIQTAEPLEATSCPFCHTSLVRALQVASHRRGPLNHLLGTGRSAVIAASLLGLPAAACDDGDSNTVDTTDVVADTSDDIVDMPVYGFPADAFVDASDVDVAPETISEAVYGMPPEPPPDASGPADVEPPPEAPVYGMPGSPGE